MLTKKTQQSLSAAHESENSLRANLKSMGGDVKGQLFGLDDGEDFFSKLLGLGGSKGSNEKAGMPPVEFTPKSDGSTEVFDFTKHNAGKLDKLAISQQKHTKLSHGEQNKYAVEKSKKSEQKAAIDYTAEILQTNKVSHQEMREVDAKIKQIMDEMKKLIATSRVLQMQFAEVSMEQAPTRVGKYYLNFFELLLSLIRTAKKNAEDASAWINATGNKNNKKQHKQFMGQGSKVTLSNERAVATQVG